MDLTIRRAPTTRPAAAGSLCAARPARATNGPVLNESSPRSPAALERQVRRMLADPRSEALVTNFTGQWLNLRGLQSQVPVPFLFPDFDDNLREAMRRETELFFDSIVREDRNIVELLNADYTF